MKKLFLPLAVIAIAILTVGSLAWSKASADDDSASRIVGAWFVKAPDAPFQYHMFAFHADGTMEQANPDDGDPYTSDSDSMGVWTKDGSKIKGKFVEVTADRTTHLFASRGEISYEITVDGDHFTGTADARFYDENGTLFRGPLSTPIEGTRVTLP